MPPPRAEREDNFASTAGPACPYKVCPMRRLGLPLGLFAIALLLAGYGGYWAITAQRLQAGLEPWAEARRAEGYGVRWQEATVTGFPLAFRIEVSDASFTGMRPEHYRATAPRLFLETRPWDLRHWHATAPDGAIFDTEQITGAAKSAEGDIATRTAEGTLVALHAQDIAGHQAAAALRIGDARLRLTLPPKAPADHRDTALAARLDLEDVTLPAKVPAVGDKIALLSFDALLKGRIPAGKLPEALAAWRDDGGTVELQQGALQWGALAVTATGTMALDEALQPEGALNATIRGQEQLVDAAVAAGRMRKGNAFLAKLALAALAHPAPDGHPEITVPMSVQDERLSIGPAKIAVPHIEWR
jgi:hypothetical protein